MVKMSCHESLQVMKRKFMGTRQQQNSSTLHEAHHANKERTKRFLLGETLNYSCRASAIDANLNNGVVTYQCEYPSIRAV